jgi:hypothetical protein
VDVVEPLSQVFESQVAGQLHVDALHLLGLELVIKVLDLGDGGVQVCRLERPDDVAGDACNFQPCVIRDLLAACLRAQQDCAVAKAMYVLVEAMIAPADRGPPAEKCERFVKNGKLQVACETRACE